MKVAGFKFAVVGLFCGVLRSLACDDLNHLAPFQ